MKNRFHLQPIIYIIYSSMTMFILSIVVFFILSIMPYTISVWWYMLTLIGSLLISLIWFSKYQITIDGDTITVSQMYGFKRITVTAQDITKIMFRYYYPNKRSTNRGIRGYKLNLNHNPKTFIKVLAHEFSFQARYEIFTYLLNTNPAIEQNKRFEQEMVFLRHKVTE